MFDSLKRIAIYIKSRIENTCKVVQSKNEERRTGSMALNILQLEKKSDHVNDLPTVGKLPCVKKTTEKRRGAGVLNAYYSLIFTARNGDCCGAPKRFKQ